MIVNSSGRYVSRTVHDHEQQGMRESRLSSWHWALAGSDSHCAGPGPRQALRRPRSCAAAPHPGAPVIEVRCDVLLGSVTVRRPTFLMARRGSEDH